jgi:hypothetical protein
MFSLQGYYKIESYRPDHSLEKSSEFMGNFITSSGLSFPLSIPFASTFKYLSLGSGTGVNTVYTTGLQIPTNQFTSMSDYVQGACGKIESPSGLKLFRAWLVSGITGQYYANGLTIGELGVSPSPISGAGTGVLFSRFVVNPTFNIPSGNYSIVTYRLDFGMPTGLQKFYRIINTSQVNATDNPVCRYWNQLSGIYSIIHNGLITIDQDGENVEPGMKASLEPCDRSDNHKAYLSTDNQQFTLNGWSGGLVDTGAFKPWNSNGLSLSSGVAQYHYTVDDATQSRLTNARRDLILVPDSGNFTTEVSLTAYQKDNSIVTFSTDSFVATGRSRSVTRLYSWPNTQNQFQDEFGNDRRVKSLVLSYYDMAAHYPYCDMQFASSGLKQNFTRNTNNFTYSGSSITGDFVFLDPYDNLSLSFRLGWSAPCPSNVSGCPGYS